MELREINISDKQQVLGFFVSEPNPDKNGRMKREETFARLFPELYSEFKDFVFSAGRENILVSTKSLSKPGESKV